MIHMHHLLTVLVMFMFEWYMNEHVISDNSQVQVFILYNHEK